MKLKITLQNYINTYLFDTLPLCIILACDNIYEWYLNHYIEVLCSDKREGNTYRSLRLKYAEGETYMDRHKSREVLEYNPILSGPIIKYIGVINFIIENINDGFYTIAFLDEFYLSNKPNYDKQHYCHESLIYGYDAHEKLVHCISFDKHNRLVSFDLTYDNFTESFNSCYEITTSGLARYMYLLKPIDMQYKFDLNKFTHSLNNYLSSEINIADKYQQFAFNRCNDDGHLNFTYGINLYDRMINVYEESIFNLKNPQSLNFYLLSEHKQAIETRLNYINKSIMKSNILDEKICDYHNEVVMAQKAVLPIIMKANTINIKSGRNNERLDSYKKEILAKMAEIKANEKEILSDINNILLNEL